jgi:hypothetical protein
METELKKQNFINLYNEEGERHGLWEIYHPNGNISYRANYYNGKLHGLYQTYNNKGELEYSHNYDMNEKVVSVLPRRKLAEQQLKLMDEVRAKADINLVTCGQCGTLLLHKNNDTSIICFGCKNEMDLSDCPDYWYEGCIENSEFDD